MTVNDQLRAESVWRERLDEFRQCGKHAVSMTTVQIQRHHNNSLLYIYIINYILVYQQSLTLESVTICMTQLVLKVNVSKVSRHTLCNEIKPQACLFKFR